MTVGIYGIFDSKTDECLYVGLSKNIEQRWRSHLKELKSKCHKRQDFVEWYHSNGAVKELLSFKILEECEPDEKTLNSAEIKWFNKLKPKYYGHKPTVKGHWTQSDATKAKIRSAMMAKYFERTCKQCNVVFYSVSNETDRCQKHRAAKKKDNKRYKKSTVFKKCEICQKKINAKRLFCSSECRIVSYGIKCENNCENFVEKGRRFCSRACTINSKKAQIKENGVSKGFIEYEELYQMYVVEGMSTRQIALKTGYSNVSIQNWLRANNIQIKSNAQTLSDNSKEKLLKELPDRNELLKYYNDRLSFDEIGKIYNTNRDKVRKWVKHYNFPPRKRPHRLR